MSTLDTALSINAKAVGNNMYGRRDKGDTGQGSRDAHKRVAITTRTGNLLFPASSKKDGSLEKSNSAPGGARNDQGPVSKSDLSIPDGDEDDDGQQSDIASSHGSDASSDAFVPSNSDEATNPGDEEDLSLGEDEASASEDNDAEPGAGIVPQGSSTVEIPRAYRHGMQPNLYHNLTVLRQSRVAWVPNCDMSDVPTTDLEKKAVADYFMAKFLDWSEIRDKVGKHKSELFKGTVTQQKVYNSLFDLVELLIALYHHGWASYPEADPTVIIRGEKKIILEDQRNLTFTQRKIAIGQLFFYWKKPVIDTVKSTGTVMCNFGLAPGRKMGRIQTYAGNNANRAKVFAETKKVAATVRAKQESNTSTASQSKRSPAKRKQNEADIDDKQTSKKMRATGDKKEAARGRKKAGKAGNAKADGSSE